MMGKENTSPPVCVRCIAVLLVVLGGAGPSAFGQLPFDITIARVAQWGGQCRGVAVDGNLVCMGMASSLLVLDGSGPGNPRLVSQLFLPDCVTGLSLVGRTAFVADGGAGLQIVDLTVAERPRLLGSAPVLEYANGVAVAGRYAYLATGGTGLEVFDVLNPSSPIRVGVCDTPGAAVDVAVSGSTAYVADTLAGLQIVDVSRPASPVRVGSLATAGFARGVALHGGRVYVASGGGGLEIVDASNPASPKVLGRCATSVYAYDVAVGEGLACIAGYEYAGVMQVIDVSNSAAPRQTSLKYLAGLDARGVAVGDGRAWVLDLYGLSVFDLSSPASPRLTGGYGSCAGATAMAVQGNLAYVGEPAIGLQVLDVTDPSHLQWVASCRASESRGLSVSDRYACLIRTSGELQFVDIQQPSKPRWLAQYVPPGWASSAAMSGDTAYVAVGATGLDIVSLASPVHSIGTYATDDDASGVTIRGNRAFVAAAGAGVEVLDILVPAVPSHVGGCGVDAWAMATVLADDHALVLGWPASLRWLDFSNPLAPHVIGQAEESGGVGHPAVRGGLAWVTGRSGGFRAFDFSRPSRSRQALFAAAPRDPTGIAAVGSYVLVADRDEGVVVYRASHGPDLDSDGDVDGADYGCFAACFNGTGRPAPDGCAPADFNGDGSVDGGDYGVFAACFNGSGNPPACD